MTRRNLLALSAFAVLAGASTAAAQSAPARLTPRNAPAFVGGAIPAASIVDARRAAEEGHLREARTLYRSVVSKTIAAGDYAGEALYGLAQTEFALDNRRAAATALDDAAEQAGKFGDPELRLRALFEAATLYRDLGERSKVADRVPAIQALLKSPVISAAVRNDISSRVGL